MFILPVRQKFLLCLLLVSFSLFPLDGCTKKKAPAPETKGRISATRAFESYFGPAPTTEKGTCFGFVIYFPSAKEPGKVVPFPFFSFDEASLKKVALERLIAGMDLRSYAGEFEKPVPPGARLISVAEKGGTATADFSGEVATAAGKGGAAGLFNAVALTLLQFNGVTAVRITSGGAELFSTQKQGSPDASAVLQPTAPRLLNVIAMKENQGAPVGEVDALFDRPVDIGALTFSSVDGTPFEGEVFHSMFDMAAVLKPKHAGLFAPGMKVKVHWKVTDKLGREGAGDDVFPLEVKVHQD